MRWLIEQPFVAWDIESTGVHVETDHVVTAAVAYVAPGEKPAILSWLLAVEIDIPAEATQVHGITTDHARLHGMPPAEGLWRLRAQLDKAIADGVPMVGSNLAYDYTILDRNLRRYGLDPLPDPIAPVVDVYVLDRHVDTYRKGTRTLTDPKEGGLCEWYSAPVIGDAHTAEADALAAARVAWRISAMTQWPNTRLVAHYADPRRTHRYGNRHRPQDIADKFLALALSTPAQLHAAQVGWKAEQAAGLRAYFEKQGKDISDIHEAWPLVPFKEESNA